MLVADWTNRPVQACGRDGASAFRRCEAHRPAVARPGRAECRAVRERRASPAHSRASQWRAARPVRVSLV